MSDPSCAANLLAQLDHLNEQQLRRLLVEHLTKQKLGLYWEANAIERDAALNADVVLPRLDDGSLGETVDWDDLLPVQEWLRASKPTVQ